MNATPSTSLIVRVSSQARDSRTLQISFIIALWWTGEAVTRKLGLPMAGSISAMLLFWILLSTRLFAVDYFKRGAEALLDHMLLFFVPATLVLIDRRELLSATGVKVLVVVALSTCLVMAATALTVDFYFQRQTQHDE